MLLGALTDIGALDVGSLTTTLGIAGRVDAERTTRGALTATAVIVQPDDAQPHRTLADVLAFNHNLIASASQLLDQTHDTAAGAVIDVVADQSVTLANIHLADLQAHTSDFHFI